MFEFLALITNKHYWKFHSIIIKLILKSYGISVGKGFYCEGVPLLKLRGKAENIQIGDYVSFLGNVDLRNRENGKIIIGNHVAIDGNVRLVAANDTILSIGEHTGIGAFTVFNCGVDVLIGKNCLISGQCYFQSSEHGIRNNGQLIAHQPHTYGTIQIGDDVWIAANVTIAKNVILEDGCVVGAKSFLRNTTFSKNSIIAGIPAKTIKMRI
ncbi:MAG: acyltransferase [Sulfuricurvum sp.]|nr:acyltransferase [Sulfuricurvum sp.]MDP3023099.1 acyltransferase [Sulfuricurvum sp.]